MIKKTTEQFVKQALAVHGDRYDYSLVEYKSRIEPVTIVCKQHGSFQQKPKHHLQGSSCPECKGVKRTNVETFIIKAIAKHGHRYDYHLCNPVSSRDVVEIICKKHGSFSQSVSDHLRGAGCVKCAHEGYKSNSLDFIAKANTLHNCKYQYFCVEYTTSKTKVCIFCNSCHQMFYQTPNDHLRGMGCPFCSISGYKSNIPGFLYALLSTDGKYLKIGITNKLSVRISTLTKVTPFPFNIYKTWCGNGVKVRETEALIHKSFQSANMKGFQGATEWLVFRSGIIDVIDRQLG